ncbi:DNA-binding response regulator [Virgibacillus doumboii]|uniref:DNA-binding response regulator n=1 Tax=Virgibacillus doumboii TaxID=2697503 RepID=UPI0013DEA525|nr:DNA-binding response regulator [Virgibacillus doumboii]
MRKNEIKDMLHGYHWMIQTIALKRSELMNDAGENITSEYSIEATLPKAPYKVGDPLFVEVNRREKEYDSIKKLERKVILVQRLSNCITDERQKIIMNKIMDGRSMRSISRHMQIPLSNLARIRDDIVNRMHSEQMEHLEQSAHS